MRHPVLTFVAAIGAVAAISACNSERAIATDPIGGPAYGIRLTNAATNLPRGTARFVVPTTGADTIRLSFAGLDSLSGASWVIWASDTAGTTWYKLTGTLRAVRTDTVTNALGDPEAQATSFTSVGVSSFKQGGPRTAFTFTTTRAQSGIPAGQLGLVLISEETDAAATAPGTVARPLWFRRQRDSLTTSASGNLNFGYFSTDPTERYVYVSGAQRGRVYVRDDVMLVNDSSLARPPRGYYYASYAIKTESLNQPLDTIYLGAQTAPAPRRSLSLKDADISVVDPLVQLGTPPQILAASTRVVAGELDGLPAVTTGNPFRQVARTIVSLELKTGKVDEARLGPAYVLSVDLPTVVRNTP